MYMRYAGSGVGHYSVALLDTRANPNETPNEDFAMDDDTDLPESVFPSTQPADLEECGITTGPEEVGDGGQVDDIESDNSEGSDEENPDQDDDDDLGAEDGEGGFVDVEDDEGYAVL
jgi:hypothetical protein